MIRLIQPGIVAVSGLEARRAPLRNLKSISQAGVTKAYSEHAGQAQPGARWRLVLCVTRYITLHDGDSSAGFARLWSQRGAAKKMPFLTNG